MPRRLFAAGLALLAVLAAAPPPAGAQPIYAWGEAEPLVADFTNRWTYVGPPPMPAGMAFRTQPAVFEIEFVGVPAAARPAIQLAADIWSTHIVSDVPVEVRVEWVQAESNILGSAAPRLVANFGTAPDRNTWFATALASALEGQDMNPTEPDILMQLNGAFQNWYFGTDANPPDDTFDLVTVVLHEIGHGLGFVGSGRITGDLGRWGIGTQNWPIVFDRFVETTFTSDLIPFLDTTVFPNPSTVLAQVLQSEELYFGGPSSIAAHVESQTAQGLAVGPWERPKLHAPEEWVAGSSYSHLTEEQEGEGENEFQPFYPPGSLNALMTPRLSATEVIRTPGPITCGMFRDMGWPLGADCEVLLTDDDIIFDEPFVIAGPCPNPAINGQTRVRVHLPEQGRVRADLFDRLGRRVQRVFDGRILPSAPVLANGEPRCTPGHGYIDVNAGGLASGVYLLRVRIDDAQQTVRVVVVN